MTEALAAAINWNGADFIIPMINSLLPQLEETGMKLLVFDNGSTDGSPELVEREFESSPLVTVKRNACNIGFGRAANRIISDFSGDAVVLVNTDTVVQPGCLKKLLQCLEDHPEVALVGPKLLWPDGTLQNSRRDFPFPARLILEHLPLLNKFTARYSKHDRGEYTDWLVGAVMAVRCRPFNENGGFSEDFLFFHEETDLQYRLWKEGWKVWFEPSARVVHYEGGCSRNLYGDSVYLHHIPGKLIFLKRNGNAADRLLFRLLMSALQVFRMATGTVIRREDIRWSRSYCSAALKLLWKGASA